MNERIRQLAHEAGLPTYNPEGIPTKLEKFAELIVRECAVTAGLMEHEGRKGIGAQILDNFGVEK
jgi:hypothetical protein